MNNINEINKVSFKIPDLQMTDKAQVHTPEEQQVSSFAVQRIQQMLDSKGASIENWFENTGNRINNILKANYDALHQTLLTVVPKYASAIHQWAMTLSYQGLSHLVNFLRYILKLPIQAVCNIMQQFYQILKLLARAAVHPVDTSSQIVHAIKQFIQSLVKIETWVNIGAGMTGAGAAQIAIGNLYGSTAVILGAILSTSALSIGTILAVWKKSSDSTNGNAALTYLLKTAEPIPETMMTGFLMSLIIGMIEKSRFHKQRIEEHLQNPLQQDIEQAAYKFAYEHGIKRRIHGIIYDHATDEVRFSWWTKGGWDDPILRNEQFFFRKYISSLKDYQGLTGFQPVPTRGTAGIFCGTLSAEKIGAGSA